MVPGKHRRAKLNDVAALAGISSATASRALNGKGPVAPETRKLVLEAVDRLNYRPNHFAKALRQKSSSHIGLVIPNLLNPYYIALADEISQLLTGTGYQLLLAATRDDPETEQGVLLDLVGQNVEGLLWVPSAPSSDLLTYLRDQHIPTVSLVRRLADDLTDTVVFEDYKGSCAASEYLIQLGHRDIGYIGGDVRHSSNYARWQGYLAALLDAGIPARDEFIKLGTTLSSWGGIATADLLTLGVPPTAIFVSSNAMMPGVLKVLRQYRVNLPEDLSLICFDDLDWFQLTVPTISAISTSPTRLAQAALDVLMQQMKNDDLVERAPICQEIHYQLEVRSSTVAPRSHPILHLCGEMEIEGS
jgi:LacI family transcriptional regulator